MIFLLEPKKKKKKLSSYFVSYFLITIQKVIDTLEFFLMKYKPCHLCYVKNISIIQKINFIVDEYDGEVLNKSVTKILTI